jgi:hypothetical protein
MSLITHDPAQSGWIPTWTRILRGVGSRLLPCGCLVGLYETYRGQTVAIVDAREEHCANDTHHVGARLQLADK